MAKKSGVIKTDGFEVDQQKIAEAISILTQVYNVPNAKQFYRALELIESAGGSLTDIVPVRADQVKAGSGDFYSTGEKWLDDWIGGGIRKKELIFLGAMPYTGKTHLAAWWAGHYALEGATVAHFTGEDLVEDLRDYYQSVGGKSLLKKVWLLDMVDYSFTAQKAGEALKKMRKDGNPVDVAVFDHMDIMQHSGVTGGGDWQDAAGVARELKILVKKEDVIGIALSQAYEKSKEHKGVGRFYRAKIGKSANADIIILMDNVIDDEYYLSRIKARGRRVQKDTEQKVLSIDWDKMRVEDITR